MLYVHMTYEHRDNELIFYHRKFSSGHMMVTITILVNSRMKIWSLYGGQYRVIKCHLIGWLTQSFIYAWADCNFYPHVILYEVYMCVYNIWVHTFLPSGQAIELEFQVENRERWSAQPCKSSNHKFCISTVIHSWLQSYNWIRTNQCS